MLDMHFNNNFLRKNLGVSIVRRVFVPSAENNINVINRVGGEGDLYINLGGKKDMVITVECNFISKKPKDLFRRVKHWLNINNIEDNKLFFTDDVDWFYIVKDLRVSQLEISKKYKGSFTIDFTCRGWHYALSGSFPVPLELGREVSLFNEFDTSKPVFFIKGNGEIKITVNGQDMVVDIEKQAYINCDLELVYKDLEDKPQNLKEGDYINFPYGYNNISIEGLIEKAEVMPNWREV